TIVGTEGIFILGFSDDVSQDFTDVLQNFKSVSLLPPKLNPKEEYFRALKSLICSDDGVVKTIEQLKSNTERIVATSNNDV
ncbi:MAG: hypothetical protein MHPSP_002545, partial [Paramarteilia canceri]